MGCACSRAGTHRAGAGGQEQGSCTKGRGEGRSRAPDLFLQVLLVLACSQQLLMPLLHLCLVPIPLCLGLLQLPHQPRLCLLHGLQGGSLLHLIQAESCQWLHAKVYHTPLPEVCWGVLGSAATGPFLSLVCRLFRARLRQPARVEAIRCV